MNWKQTRNELTQAILDRDIERIGKIADQLRFEAKLNYDQSFAVANELTGIDEQEWDSILYEADETALRR